MQAKERGLVWGLLESAGDGEKKVRSTVAASIITLGRQHPALVLTAIHSFIHSPQTAPKVHVQTILYNTVENIVRECGESIEETEVVTTWLTSALQILTQPSASPDLQEAAQGLVVALGSTRRHSSNVMDSLVAQVQSEMVPTQCVAETLGTLSSSNVTGTIPYIKALLGLIVPSLAAAKQDSLRVALATMLAKFSEAIMEACANKSPDPNISEESYQTECAIIFETLVNSWLKSSNSSVRNETIITLGHMSHLLPKDKLEELGGLVLNTIISFYRRTNSPYNLTFSLALLVDAILKMNLSDCLKFHVDSLLGALFNQVCVTPNYSEPMTVKNHYEVLRCYELLGKPFAENTLGHLLQRLENASHMQRVGALVVAKHLINSKTLKGGDTSSLLPALVPILGDPNSKVVKSMTQVVVALCHNEHLNAQTAQPFVTYLVKHCAGGSTPQGRRPSLAEIEGESVAEVSSRVLHVLATTVDAARGLLWPLLLAFVCKEEYEASLPTTLGCLAHLAHIQEPPKLEDKTILSGPPGPPVAPVLISRLLVLSCQPGETGLGIPALTLLQGLAPHIHPSLKELWDEEIPQLIITYKELVTKSHNIGTIKESRGPLQLWQDSLRDFLASTILSIQQEEFNIALGNAQMDQLPSCRHNQGHLCFLVSLVGITLKHSGSKTFIATTLNALFQSTNHKSTQERESLSLAVGITAATHTDIVLTHIEIWLKNADNSKKSMSFFSFVKQDQRVEECTWPRTSVVICLGQIATLAPADVVASRVDGPIMLHLLNIINSNKSDIVNEAVLVAVSHIARALAKLPMFKLRQRPLLITHLVNTAKQDNISHPMLASILQALRDLIALEPELNVEERTIILQTVFASTLNRFTINNASNNEDMYLNKCSAQLSVLIRTIIQKDTNPATLDDVTTLLQSWTVAPSELVRIKSLELLHTALRTYNENLNFTPEGPTSFNQSCQLLAFLAPRLSDPNSRVRTEAVGSTFMVLRIAGRYNGQQPDYTDEDMETLKNVEEQISVDDQKRIDSLVQDVAKVISNKLSFVAVRSFLSYVVVGLQDKLESSSAAVGLILETVFTLRGHQMHQHIKELLGPSPECIHSRLSKVQSLETRRRTVESITALAKHNLTLVVDTMLTYPLPYERSVCESWRSIGHDPKLLSEAVTHISHILERTQPYTEQPTNTEQTVKIATLPPLSAICGLRELLYDISKIKVDDDDLAEWDKLPEVSEADSIVEWTESQNVIETAFPSLCGLLLLSYGCYVDVEVPLHQTTSTNRNSFVPNRGATTIMPTKMVLRCLQGLVGVLGCSSLSSALGSKVREDRGEETIDTFLHTTTDITSMLVHEAPRHISALAVCLDTRQAYEMQRVAVSAVFAQLIAEKCGGNYELLESITDGLLSRLNDRSVHVRRLAVRGLANFAYLQHEHHGSCQIGFISNYRVRRPDEPQMPTESLSEKLTEIVSALVGATDQRDGGDTAETQVALEALRGLASLLPCLPQETVLQHTPTLLIRIRLFSEKSSGEVREAGLGVLRGLAASVGSSDELQEHLHLHLLAALIHLADPHPPTVVMCKSALLALGPHLGSTAMNEMFQSHLEPSKELNYHNFVTELTKHMVSDLNDHLSLFIQASSSYFKSNEASLRRAASLLIGNLIYHCEDTSSLSIASVSHGLLYLLRDPEPSVRSAAAIAIPLLYRHDTLL